MMAWFLNRVARVVTLFASLALAGQWIPWNTNRIKRVRQEAGKRSKRRGMGWSAQGSLAILTMILVRFVGSTTYQAHRSARLLREQRFFPDHGIRAMVTSFRRKFTRE
jgi:hypothetical protein